MCLFILKLYLFIQNTVSQNEAASSKAPVTMVEMPKTTVVPLQSTDPSTSQCHDNPAQDMDEFGEQKKVDQS
jgi:hypothetical protein